MPKIKVKALTRQIIVLAHELGLKAVPEYRTPDGTRIDIAVLDGEKKLLAIELEASFKWFPQRVLYDVVKAHRAGFSELWVVTQFRAKPGWIGDYAKEVGIKLALIGPEEAFKKLKGVTSTSVE